MATPVGRPTELLTAWDDHRNDPLEMRNLMDSRPHSEQPTRMSQLLVELAGETEDPLLERVRGATGRSGKR